MSFRAIKHKRDRTTRWRGAYRYKLSVEVTIEDGDYVTSVCTGEARSNAYRHAHQRCATGYGNGPTASLKKALRALASKKL